MSKIKADTIFIFSLVESTSIFSCETAIIFAIKDLFYSFFFFFISHRFILRIFIRKWAGEGNKDE